MMLDARSRFPRSLGHKGKAACGGGRTVCGFRDQRLGALLTRDNTLGPYWFRSQKLTGPPPKRPASRRWPILGAGRTAVQIAFRGGKDRFP